MKTLSAQDQLKREAALAAIDELVEDTIVGVGTGSTANFFIDELALRKTRFRGAVSSSVQSSERLRAHGIQVFDLNEVVERDWAIPVYVDGADEINPQLAMIKGAGGALTQEKIVAAWAGRFICVADSSKWVERLGAFPLPVEIIASARSLLVRRFASLGARAMVRAGFTTDNGHPVLDVAGLDIVDPRTLESEINSWPGVVTVGLFANRGADLALIASKDGVRRVTRG